MTPGWYAVRGGAWEVEPATVERMRAAIGEQSDRSTLDGYIVQYQGVLDRGRRSVRLAGACRDLGLSADSVREQFLAVLDGGKCYFDADYDPTEQRFTRFAFHGYA